jgi:large subunit ribosomal protein L10
MAELTTNAAVQAEKAATVAEVHEKLKAAKVAIVTEYRGLTVTQMTRLRQQMRQAAGEYHVIKNTLVKRALKDTAYGALDRLLDGPNGWVFGYEDPVAVSKTLIKFIEENEKLRIKGALFEGEFMDQAKVKVLSQMPSKPEMQARLLALMLAPATQLVRLMQEPAAMMARLLESIRKQKESQS